MVEQERTQVAFPRLSAEQMDLLAENTETLDYPEGTVLFAAGDTDYPFFIVRRGTVCIVETSQGVEQEVAIHQPGEFTGDIDMLTGRRSIVTAIAGPECRVLKLEAEALREVIRSRSALGDLLLNAFLMRRTLLLETDFAGVRVIGSRWSRDTFRIRDFLARNHVPFTWLDLERDAGAEQLLASLHIHPAETPILLLENREPLRNPSNQGLAEAVGITTVADEELYDLVVVGGGPAGLAAAVYGASEGLKTVVLEENAPGGQASWSSKIENYLGFPTGLSGAELAERATLQAEKFGVTILTPCCATQLEDQGDSKVITLTNGQKVSTRTVVIATGATYQRLPVADLARYEGASVFYSATAVEARLCQELTVGIVGGGNSAGQAAIFLADHTHSVQMFVRGDTLATTMSRYLIQRIEQAENIEVAYQTEILGLHGEPNLECVTARHRQNDTLQEYPLDYLFIFIGAKPHTGWLNGAVALDRHGFIKTGDQLAGFRQPPVGRPRRRPYMLETDVPGVFAAGDVRAGSVKRVASAVGEGAMAVQFVHQVLAE